MSVPLSEQGLPPLTRRLGLSLDAWLCVGLASLAFGLAWVLALTAPDRLFAPETLGYRSNAGNVWFQSDVLRVLQDMSDRQADHPRAVVHPLFSLLTLPVVTALQWLPGVDARAAAALFSAATAAATVALLYLTLRRLGRQRAEAALLCALLCASAGWLFFYTVPEAFQLGGLTIMLALYVAAAPPAASPRREQIRVWWVSAATLAVTLTNWMFGWLLALGRLRPLAAAAVTAGALAAVAAGAGLQHQLLPNLPGFGSLGGETSFMLKEEAGGPLAVAKVFWFDTVVAPRPDLTGPNPHWQALSFQHSPLGSGSPLAWPALALWAALLALGLLRVCRRGALPPGFRLVLVGGLVGQWALHAVYGEETFLYALHFLPLLVVLASLAFDLPAGRPMLSAALFALLATLVGLSLVHNGQALDRAKQHAAEQGSTRTDLLEEMARRPLGPWPRGQAHVLLGVPGASSADKAYFEPGGSFSPWVGSFGVSVWAVDASGSVKATSDSIGLRDTRQEVALAQGRWPSVAFATPLYTGRWAQDAAGVWQLGLEAAAGLPAGQSLQLLVRGVGPAAGPLRHLEWRPATRTLLIEGRWRLRLPEGAAVRLGDEHQDGWETPAGTATSVRSPTGWAYARIDWPATASKASIEALESATVPAPALRDAVHLPQVEVPEPAFVASLHAQVHHLAMSVDGREVRPGDPLNYGQAWLRDSAYVAAALAQSGNLALARELALDLAQRDFFGGFGAEADAPGIALWALQEVASRLRDPVFDRSVWPDVQRKAAWIVACLDAEAVLMADPEGAVLGRHALARDTRLACLPADGDLIAGRMDWHVPRLYLTAFSYRGLMDAAEFATRLGHRAHAEQWTQAAARLQAAWNGELTGAPRELPSRGDLELWIRAAAAEHGLYGVRSAAKLWSASRKAGGELNNPRTFISGTWPTRVALQGKQAYAERLFRQPVPGPAPGHARPRWTYFDIALAHQALYLGRPERAWETLRRYWDHSVAPGTYTWWEGEGEENTSYGWQALRGWVSPPHVTPHYWTAAEVLALQLEMLAMLDDDGGAAQLVIGAGVPATWLTAPVSAAGLQVRGARVDWRWDGGRVEVSVTGARYPVRLGPSFPAGTPVTVRHVDGP
ncbi:hypothetical protein [Caldimonas brevitalea]|uniref:Uncharacterized protein n=1 Tax=Caldimonas brevitalea TaxID=413882 RepID=A0A0G3BST8_9BURK|nr:hypothetical protein [Caldimonas brevitalea]AKJ31073.1 hypothetical protein AAW51_4382 [Caldimonas brevitalea]